MELEVYKKSDFYEDYISSQKEYYERENADAYFAERLAEKDKLIASLQDTNKILAHNDVRLNKMLAEKDKEIAELKQKLENVQASMYCDVVDANMEVRRLRRALYKACSNWARSERYTEATWHGDEHREELWAEVQDKCLKKLEEYR